MMLSPQEHFLKLCVFGKYDDIVNYYNIYKNQIDISHNNEEAFFWSCANGSLDIAQWLLLEKPSIHISANNEQAFRVACSSGHLNILQWLYIINPNIDISVFDERAFTNSCFSGNLNVVKWLISIKPSIDITSEKHYGIGVASLYKHYHIVNYLIELYIERNIDIPQNIMAISRLWIKIPCKNTNTIECLICYDTTDIYHTTPCNHNYCSNCINTWISCNNSCPYCRCVI